MSSLLNDFLDALGVPHTQSYTDQAFATMPFKSLFGLSRQLKAYGVDTVGARWTDKSVLPEIPTPFLAQTGDRFVIVEAIDKASNTVSTRCSHRGRCSTSIPDFEEEWSGLALLAYPTEGAKEPDLKQHRFTIATNTVKKWLLAICIAVLMAAGIVNDATFTSAGRVALLLVDLAGLAVTWLLILKSLKVSSHSADRICGILQEHGCDTVLEQKASTFFGIVSWSEVGFSYFFVTTAIMLIFPAAIGWLAIINLCCLPFTFWSIWYQRFRIHTWCTLCVTTQALLWLEAGSYLWSGAWHSPLPMTWEIIAIPCAYGAMLFGLNCVMNFIKKHLAQ